MYAVHQEQAKELYFQSNHSPKFVSAHTENMFAQLSLELHTVSYHTNNEAHSAFIMQLALNLRGSILYFHNVHKEKEN